MDLAYAYSNARVKAMKSKLLNESRMRELLDVGTIPEMIGILEESEYHDSFVGESVKYKGMELMMRALNKDLERSLQRLSKIVPHKGAEALKLLMQEYEVQNLKNIISAKATGLQLKEEDLVFFGRVQEKQLRRLLEKNSVEEVLKELKGTELGKALRRAAGEYEKGKDFRIFNSALDMAHYKKLRELEKRSQGVLLKELINSKIRLKNLMVVLRLKKGNPAANARQFLIDASDSFARELNELNDFEKILERVKAKHPKMAEAVEESRKRNSLIPIEIALEREFVQSTNRSLRAAVLDLAALLGYMYLKEGEISAIRKIAYAKQYGFTNELKQMVFTVNV